MTDVSKLEWTEADYPLMSWHDNHIHGLNLAEGVHGTGDLELDIDYIVEWLKSDSGGICFRIAPANLTFREVSNLKVSLDYGVISAAMGPFSIDGIDRRIEQRARYTATLWTIKVNFPVGEISFEASGFDQVLRRGAITTEQQVLSISERSADA